MPAARRYPRRCVASSPKVRGQARRKRRRPWWSLGSAARQSCPTAPATAAIGRASSLATCQALVVDPAADGALAGCSRSGVAVSRPRPRHACATLQPSSTQPWMANADGHLHRQSRLGEHARRRLRRSRLDQEKLTLRGKTAPVLGELTTPGQHLRPSASAACARRAGGAPVDAWPNAPTPTEHRLASKSPTVTASNRRRALGGATGRGLLDEMRAMCGGPLVASEAYAKIVLLRRGRPAFD